MITSLSNCDHSLENSLLVMVAKYIIAASTLFAIFHYNVHHLFSALPMLDISLQDKGKPNIAC
eukprot:IDg11762t1